MKIIDFDINIAPEKHNDIVLVLGFFDGMHLGHQKLIEEALKEGYPVGVLSFDNSPAYLLGYKKEDSYLMSAFNKADFLEELNVKYFYLMRFEKETLKITKDEFIEKVLKEINPRMIVCGEDFKFGVRGEGTPQYLKYFFETKIVKLKRINGEKISTRTIISHIENGMIKEANDLLGHPYLIEGLVVHGNHKGSSINFPTANLELDYPYVVPKVGVYAGYAYFLKRKRKALICVSTHPTYEPLKEPIIEVHIMDFKEDLYGKHISIELISFIRDILHFDSLEELKAQIEKDADFAKKTLQ